MMSIEAEEGRVTTAKRIAESLRDAIVCLELKPGDTISESDIAARFGVSRQPVREAFIQLAEAGLVRIRPQRPTEIVKISVREVLNARFVREALETAVIVRAAAIGWSLPRDHFDAMIERQRAMAIGENYRTFHELDDAFHREIARLAGCDFVWKLIDAQKMQMDRVRYLSLLYNRTSTVGEHRRIADAILDGDAGLAVREMREHLGKIDTHIRHIREAHRGFFMDGED